MGNERPGPSLKARAVNYLSRREHSRHELRRKLSAYSDDPDEIDAVLNELQRDRWQSDARYAQSYADSKATRHGTARIVHDLRQHGVGEADIGAVADALADSEWARAHTVWARKFGELPADARAYARQYRFMATRGFSADCIRRILRGADGDNVVAVADD